MEYRVLKSHKIRCTFQTRDILCKLVSKPKDRVDTEQINIYKIDSIKCQALYFDKCSWYQDPIQLKSRSNEHEFFSLSEFSFTKINGSQDSRGMGRLSL